MKKLWSVLLAMLVFALVSVGFTQGLWEILDNGRKDQKSGMVYHRPSESAEKPEKEIRETKPEETLPPETVPETQPEAVRLFQQVPLYDQTAYPYTRYQYGTLADSGSNIACLAMVATYLTDQEYLPDELAGYFANYIGNPMQWLEYASDQLQLPWYRTANIDETIQALREGKIAIARMNEGSIFGEAPHFLVFTGITEDNKILIHDPYSPNYSSWQLENALVNGFDRGDLTGGYSGGWVYDPAAMPEQPFVYAPPVSEHVFRYGDLSLSQEDMDLIVKLICAEGESEPFDGQQGIAEVILNRMAAGNFPDTARGVIFAEGQFLGASQLHNASPSHIQYEALDRALNGPYVLDGDVVFFSKFAVNDNVWGTIGSHIFCRQW